MKSNAEQIRDCVSLMGKLVPLVIEIMLDHPEALWGDACYPVVAQARPGCTIFTRCIRRGRDSQRHPYGHAVVAVAAAGASMSPD